MKSRWSDTEAARCVERWGPRRGEALALRTYTSRLLGAEPDLVLHGGGNTSLKGTVRDLFGDEAPALFVKASGGDLASIEPEGHVAVRLDPLRRWPELTGDLDDLAAEREMRALLFDPGAATPSIEAPVHAVVPGRYADHTHAGARDHGDDRSGEPGEGHGAERGREELVDHDADDRPDERGGQGRRRECSAIPDAEAWSEHDRAEEHGRDRSQPQPAGGPRLRDLEA